MAGMQDFYLLWGDKLKQGINQIAGVGDQLIASDQRDQAAQNELQQFVERRANAARQARMDSLAEMDRQRKIEAEEKEQKRKDEEYGRSMEFMKWVAEQEGAGIDRDIAMRQALGKGLLGPKDYLELTKPKEAKAPEIDPAMMTRFQTEFLPSIKDQLLKMKTDPTAATDIAYLGAQGGYAGFKPYEDFINNLKGMRPESQSSLDRLAMGQAGQLFQQENTLRDEYSRDTKQFNTAFTAYKKLSQALERNNPTDAYSAIINYVRTLDPNSTVREAEEKLARERSAGTPLGRLVQGIANWTSGELTPDIRKNLYEAGRGLVQSEYDGYRAVQDNTRKAIDSYIADGYKINPGRVIITDYTPEYEREMARDLGIPGVSPQAPKPAKSTATVWRRAANGKEYEYDANTKKPTRRSR